MYIEFLGAPGTGKSTLAAMAVRYLQEWGTVALAGDDAIPLCAARTFQGRIVSAATPQSGRTTNLWRVFSCSRAYYRFRFAAENYTFWRELAVLQQGRPIPPEHRRLVRRYLGRTMSLYQFCKSYLYPDETLVLDEGFAHRVTHFVSDVEQLEPAAIIRYVDFMPRSDLVIVVCASVSSCLDRVWARGLDGRLKGKDKREVQKFVANSAKTVDIAADHLVQLGRNTVQVDNDGDLKASSASLKQQLELFVSRDGAPAGPTARSGQVG